MASRRSGVVVECPPRTDGSLSVVKVEWPNTVILSSGEPLVARYEKLMVLAEQVCQEQAAVTVRTWWTPDGIELIELHRGAPNTNDCSATPLKPETVF